MKPTYVLCTLLCSVMTGCFWSNTPSSSGQTETPTPGSTLNNGQTDSGTQQQEPSKLVFVTRATFGGNLGGLAGADAKCATAAAAVGIAGTFVAFLSTSTVDAASRVTGNGPWSDLKGRRVFDAGAARWAGFPKVSIRTDETGDDELDQNYLYWTGSEAQSTSSTNTCVGWSNANVVGNVGSKSHNDHQWLDYGYRDCSAKLPIICVQND